MRTYTFKIGNRYVSVRAEDVEEARRRLDEKRAAAVVRAAKKRYAQREKTGNYHPDYSKAERAEDVAIIFLLARAKIVRFQAVATT